MYYLSPAAIECSVSFRWKILFVVLFWFEMKIYFIASFLATGLISTVSLASQPLDASEKSTISAYQSLAMSETDMDGVSAIAGQNILNIHGSTAAGLMQENQEPQEDDQTLNEWGFSEGTNTQVFANQELSKIESDSNSGIELHQNLTTEAPSIEIDSSIKGSAGSDSFTTTSEVNYKKSNYRHDTTQLEGNAISIARDLKIDLLKIENISGDDLQLERSVGNIYLSNWSSRGDTTLTPR